MDGRAGSDLGGTGIETLDGVVLLGEVPAVIGVESRMALRQRLVVGGEVAVSDGEETGIGIVTMITGGYHHLEGTVIPRLLGAVYGEAAAAAAIVGIVGTAEEAGEGRETRDLVAHPAENPDMIERVLNPDGQHTRRGGIMWDIHMC
jgi:hypothetical protein